MMDTITVSMFYFQSSAVTATGGKRAGRWRTFTSRQVIQCSQETSGAEAQSPKPKHDGAQRALTSLPWEDA